MQQQDPIDTLLDQIEKGNSPDHLLQALTLLEKLISNIVSNPTDPKYRTIKTTNAAIQAKLLSVKGIERLIIMLGYQQQGENYVIPDETIGVLLLNSSSVTFRRRLVIARMTSPEEYRKQLEVVNNQRILNRKMQKEAAEHEALRKKAENDKQQRKHMKADSTQSRQLQFGSKANTWKDIGVDLCKKGG